MQNILIISERFYPEEFKINDLSFYWAQKGFKVGVLTQTPSYPFGRIFSGYKNRPIQIETVKKVKIYRVFTVPGYTKNLVLKIMNYISFMLATTLSALFIGYKYDRIFIFQTGPLTQALAGIVIKKVYRKKVAIWTQDVWPDTVYAYGFKKSRILKVILDRFVQSVYRNCEYIFVSCEPFIKKIKGYVKDKKIFYFPNWADETGPGKMRLLMKLSKVKRVQFTFAGNIGKVQNLENVIKAFLSLPSAWKIQLNIIGDGSNLMNLKDLAKHDRNSRIVFWGRQPVMKMPRFYGPSDVLIISLTNKPIFRLTIPSKFQTYLSAGKPIFSIMKGVVTDMVRKYDLGITADPDDLKNISEGFRRLYLMKRSEHKKFGSNAKKLLREQFNKEMIMKNMTEILNIERG
ncbi:MAG: glycosyltransferase family 4 protein [Spirochaetes bacterium]|nr:glycosyltransferase family 4 protein [Spirochaetota bacterium]